MNIENTVNDVQDSVVGNPENENAVNAAQNGVVDRQNAEDDTIAGVQNQQGTEGVAKPHQSSEENSKFAEMRREAQGYKSQLDTLNNTINGILPGLQDYGFKGTTLEEIALEMQASKTGVPVDELKKQESQRKTDIENAINSDPRILEAERITMETQYAKDLAAVKAAFPDVNANSVTELGDIFLKGMAAGLSPEDAYAAQLNYSKRTTKPEPPKMGTVKQSFEAEKETFSEDELNTFSKDELIKNPKLLEKAMKSLIKK